MYYMIKGLASAGLAAVSLVAACTAGSEDITATFSGMPEVERLRHFKEIHAQTALTQRKLSGDGVRVTIMGEMVDATHPELSSAVQQQFNAFARSGSILPGIGNAAYKSDLLGKGDGHGTHIAGTIAAACDDVGIQGIACNATLDVYALGAYDGSDRFLENPDATAETDTIIDFLSAFRTAITDVTRRGTSKITTGSFNIEAPAIRFETDKRLTSSDLIKFADTIDDDIDTLVNSEVFDGASANDKAAVARFAKDNEDDFSIPVMAITPLLDEYDRLANAIDAYQKSGGVYIITESNLDFGNYSSTLNALPSLSTKVDPDLWLSVVMVQPEGIENVTTKAQAEAALAAGRYRAPMSGCGEMAKDYCIVTPSYQVLSSMTDRVADPSDPILQVDGRNYQVYSGHSMGAPMVAAALALMQEFNTKRRLGLSMRQMVEILKDSADRGFEGYNPVRHGRGLLNVDAAINSMANL